MTRANTKKLIIVVNDPEDVEIRYEMPRENITDAHRAVVKEIQQALVRLVKVGAKP